MIEFKSGQVVVKAEPGGYAASIAQSTARQCDQAISACWKILREDGGGETIEIALIDAPVGVGADSQPQPPKIEGQQVSVVVAADAANEPLEVTAMRAAMCSRYGLQATDHFALTDGLAGMVYLQGQGRSAWVSAETALAVNPEIAALTLPDGSRPLVVGALFTRFLLDNYGSDQVLAALKAAGEGTSDKPWIQGFGQPLALLLESWASRGLGASKGSPLSDLWNKSAPLYRKRAGQMVSLTALIVGTAVLMQVPAKFGAESVVTVVQNPSGVRPGEIAIIALVLVASALASFYLSVLRAQIGSRIHRGIVYDLRLQMFAKLQRLPHSFYSRAKVGDLSTRFNEDLLQVRSGLEQITSGMTQQLVIGLATGIHLFLVNWVLAIAVLLVVGAFSFYYPTIAGRLRQASGAQRAMTGESSSVVVESASGHAVGKAFLLEPWFLRRLNAALGALDRAEISLVNLTAVFSGFMALALSLATVVAFIGAAILASSRISGMSDLAMLTKFLTLVPMLVGPATALSGIGQAVQSASGSLDRVSQILDAPIEIEDSRDAIELERVGEVAFESVAFGYEPGRTVLDGLTLAIPEGQFVAVVGESGSGKSTLTNLVMRFYDPLSGRVTMDGHDLRSVTLDSLRSRIGLVFQDTFVFNSTLRENILLGLGRVSDGDFRDVCRFACVDGFVQHLDSGYDTVLGERGSRLSGGQRQRIGLARALIRKPDLLVLDEATSALDPVTEASVLAAICQLRGTMSILMITHRMESAKLADRVVVLAGGKVVEDGPPANLLAAGGVFATMSRVSQPDGRVEFVSRSLAGVLKVEAEQLEMLAHGSTDRSLEPGDTVFDRGDPADALYIVLSGAAEVVLEQGGAPVVVNTLLPGQVFGEAVLGTGGVRQATVRAAKPTVLARIDVGLLTVVGAVTGSK